MIKRLAPLSLTLLLGCFEKGFVPLEEGTEPGYCTDSLDNDGNDSPALKPTRLLTNSPAAATMLGRRCDNRYTHTRLEGRAPGGGIRIERAQVYPAAVVREIVAALRQQRDWDRTKRGTGTL